MDYMGTLQSLRYYLPVVLSVAGTIAALRDRKRTAIALAVVSTPFLFLDTCSSQHEEERRDAARRQVYLQLAEASGAFGSTLAIMAF
jgi:hypothetical protein